MNVCALIAAFNEEPTIAAVVAGVRRHTPDVVVVDDGSSDRTGERAAAAGATVVRHAQNRGKGAAIRTGLARPGCDLVIAERLFVKGSMPTARFYSNRIGSWILSRFIGLEISDSQSGFRLIRSDCLRPLRLTATGYEVETEMLIKLVRRRASLCRVSIPARYDGSRSRLRSVRDTFHTCMLAVWYRYLSSR